MKKHKSEKSTLAVIEEDKSKKKIYMKKPYFSCLNYEIKEIGDELIYVSLMALNKIKRKELYNGAFFKKSKLTTSPNVIGNTEKFNNLITFIIEDILSYDYPKKRAEIIERWANIGDYCRKNNDYNDAIAINSVFKSFIIEGLKKTWGMVGRKAKKIIKKLDEFCAIEGNYKNIRNNMKLLNYNELYIPHLRLLLMDLNYYEENFKYLVNGNLINFDKINGIQKTIDDFFGFQNINYRKKIEIGLNEDLNFFENLESITEDYLETIANKLEPEFKIYNNPKKTKRLTSIDKKYFRGHLRNKSNKI